MKYTLNYIGIFSIALLLITACTPKKKMLDIKWFDNPNGQSELALTMREMYDAMAIMKFKIENNKKINTVPSFDKIRTATPTNPSMTEGAFDAYAQAWLHHLSNMKTSTIDNQGEKYTTLIQSCISCHEQSCGGPIVRIKKLFLNQE